MKRRTWQAIGALIFAAIPLAACGGKVEERCDPDAGSCTQASVDGGASTEKCTAWESCGSGGMTIAHCEYVDDHGACKGANYTISNGRIFTCATCGDCADARARAYGGCTVDPGPPSPPSPPSPPPPPDDAGPPLACPPQDESSFTPTLHPPARIPGACTQAQIDAYRQCLDAQQTGNGTACDSVDDTANPKCSACVQTSDTASRWGVIVAHGTTMTELNIAGCLSLATGDPSGGGCPGAFQAANECTDAACLGCFVGTQSDLNNIEACFGAAAEGTCAPYQGKAACADKIQSTGTAPECFGGQSFTDLFASMAPLFCL